MVWEVGRLRNTRFMTHERVWCRFSSIRLPFVFWSWLASWRRVTAGIEIAFDAFVKVLPELGFWVRMILDSGSLEWDGEVLMDDLVDALLAELTFSIFDSGSLPVVLATGLNWYLVVARLSSTNTSISWNFYRFFTHTRHIWVFYCAHLDDTTSSWHPKPRFRRCITGRYEKSGENIKSRFLGKCQVKYMFSPLVILHFQLVQRELLMVVHLDERIWLRFLSALEKEGDRKPNIASDTAFLMFLHRNKDRRPRAKSDVE